MKANLWYFILQIRVRRAIASIFEPIIFSLDQLFQVINGKKNNLRIDQVVCLPKIEKLAIYASYPEQVTAKELQSNILTLKELGFYVLLVTNTNSQPTSPNKFADHHLRRINKGRDLAAYRDGILLAGNSKLEELLLLNDSCYWLPEGMKETVKKLETANSQITSLTMSYQKKKHMQTFLLLAKRDSILMLKEFFKLEVKNWYAKRTIVGLGELRLTEWLEKRESNVTLFFLSARRRSTSKIIVSYQLMN
jgi:hypothetical protein